MYRLICPFITLSNSILHMLPSHALYILINFVLSRDSLFLMHFLITVFGLVFILVYLLQFTGSWVGSLILFSCVSGC